MNLELSAQEAMRFFVDLDNWDQYLTVWLKVEGADMNRGFMEWLADIGTVIANHHPHVEVIAYAKHWQSFPGGYALVTNEYSGHNFARSPKNAGVISRNLQFAAKRSVPVSLEVSFCFKTGGARFNWERAAGVQSPDPIFNRGLCEEDPVWTPADALAWAKKNWKSQHQSLPQSIKAAIYRGFGLGSREMYLDSENQERWWYYLSPAEFQPDGYTPPVSPAWWDEDEDED